MSTPAPGSRGLRLGNVVILGLIAVLGAGLYLTYAQRTREYPGRPQTINNLGHIAKAMHLFAADSPDGGQFPQANSGIATPGRFGTGPFAAVIPWMEVDQERTSPTADIKSFFSPTDTTNRPRQPGLTSYTYNPALLGLMSDPADRKPSASLNRIPDGTVNTLLLCEQVMNCGGTLNPWSGNRGLDGVTVDRAANTVTTVSPSGGDNFPGSNSKRAGTCNPSSPSGSHHGVILVAMADASVRAVRFEVMAALSGKTGATNWQAIVNPADGGVPGADW